MSIACEIGPVSSACTFVVPSSRMLAPAIPSAGFGKAGLATPVEYALSQAGVIAHYIRLSLWPANLCLDYAWPVAKSASEIALPLALILILLAAGVGSLRRAPAFGFLAAWFFLILAPSSSIMPINDLAAEHRMYLPLMAVVIFVVTAGFLLLQKMPYALRAGIVAGLVLALGIQTIKRNADYESKFQIWSDVVEKRPENLRAAQNLRSEFRNLTMAQLEEQAEHMPLGTADEVAQRIIDAAESAGANQVQIAMNRGCLPHDLFMNQIERFAREVLPRLQAHEVKRVPAAEEALA